MNDLFEHFFEDLPNTRPFSAGYPALNAWEDGDHVYLEAELPGMTMDDVELLACGNEVTINGERKIAEQENAAYHRRERTAGRFSRTITLPWEVNCDKAEAKLTDGVLSVRLPKAETSKPKRVQI
jgi:HSP20 family protein